MGSGPTARLSASRLLIGRSLSGAAARKGGSVGETCEVGLARVLCPPRPLVRRQNSVGINLTLEAGEKRGTGRGSRAACVVVRVHGVRADAAAERMEAVP